ncbi:hypothetical protein BaRGS_00014457 [Batillaria attramentaria]|uniref:Uncharacterized protein n=1 Tax=Batillaria attramentaria TaxID=370345 RepID=A0ABD0L466_9CAEN
MRVSQTADMADSGSGAGAGYYFQNGVWLSRGESTRSERYQKWMDEKTRSKMRNLDQQQHSNLVKLNSECLQMRTELRELKQEKRQRTRRHGSSDSTDGMDSVSTASFASSTSSGMSRGLRKSPSTGSIVSSSSGYSSLPSSHGAGRSIHSSGGDRGAGTAHGGRGSRSGVGSVALNPDVVALKLKNLHSARSLSKLKNDMDI